MIFTGPTHTQGRKLRKSVGPRESPENPASRLGQRVTLQELRGGRRVSLGLCVLGHSHADGTHSSCPVASSPAPSGPRWGQLPYPHPVRRAWGCAPFLAPLNATLTCVNNPSVTPQRMVALQGPHWRRTHWRLGGTEGLLSRAGATEHQRETHTHVTQRFSFLPYSQLENYVDYFGLRCTNCLFRPLISL